jgi:hypothetical protein
MNIPTLCETIGQETRIRCGIKESIEASLRSLEDQLCGLDFSIFKA